MTPNMASNFSTSKILEEGSKNAFVKIWIYSLDELLKIDGFRVKTCPKIASTGCPNKRGLFMDETSRLFKEPRWAKIGPELIKIAGTFFSELQILKKIEVVIQILLIMATFTPGH